MMITYPLFDTPIEFAECKINILIVESQSVLVKMVQDLLAQKENGEGEFVLSENYKPISISKNLEVVKDFFEVNPNEKKVINSIYSEIEKEAYSSEQYIKTNNQLGELKSYISDMIQRSELNLTYSEDVSISSLLKIFDVKIDIENQSLILRLVEYIDTLSKHCNIKCFVLINLKSYFTDEEVLEFYKYIFYSKVNVLLIESSFREKLCNEEKIYILDKDICFIY